MAYKITSNITFYKKELYKVRISPVNFAWFAGYKKFIVDYYSWLQQ